MDVETSAQMNRSTPENKDGVTLFIVVPLAVIFGIIILVVFIKCTCNTCQCMGKVFHEAIKRKRTSSECSTKTLVSDDDMEQCTMNLETVVTDVAPPDYKIASAPSRAPRTIPSDKKLTNVTPVARAPLLATAPPAEEEQLTKVPIGPPPSYIDVCNETVKVHHGNNKPRLVSLSFSYFVKVIKICVMFGRSIFNIFSYLQVNHIPGYYILYYNYYYILQLH